MGEGEQFTGTERLCVVTVLLCLFTLAWAADEIRYLRLKVDCMTPAIGVLE